MVHIDVWEDRELGGRWRLGERISAGGMAYVYRAQDRNTGQFVAIKILRTDPEMLSSWEKRFTQEARILEGLDHPSIVRTLDFSRDDHVGLYLVMEFLAGENLREYLDHSPGGLGLTETLRLFAELTSGLDYIHRQGLLHRDLKPANVILTEKTRQKKTWTHAKLIDFGIARLFESDSPITLAGTTLGTPQYMSPEQAQGMLAPDPRMDLYSLGVLLFEALTGRLPFLGDSTYSLMSQHVQKPPPLLSDVNPFFAKLPELEQASQWFLSKKADDRPSTASVFWRALIHAIHAYALREAPALDHAIQESLSLFPTSPVSSLPPPRPSLPLNPRTPRASNPPPSPSASEQAHRHPFASLSFDDLPAPTTRDLQAPLNAQKLGDSFEQTPLSHAPTLTPISPLQPIHSPEPSAHFASARPSLSYAAASVISSPYSSIPPVSSASSYAAPAFSYAAPAASYVTPAASASFATPSTPAQPSTASPHANTETLLIQRALQEIHHLVGVGIVDIDTGFLVDVHTARPHDRDVLDLVAATTTELFEGPSSKNIEALLQTARSTPQEPYFRECVIFSSNLVHFFGRLHSNPRVVMVFVCPAHINVGMLLIRARNILSSTPL